MSNANGTTSTDTQFSVFLANKPKLLARVCQQLADDKVNIVAMSMMDSSEHGVLRLLASNSDEARSSLQAVNVPMTESRVLVATLPNRPGALADVVERLSSSAISVNYAYATTGAPGGKTTGVFCVSNIQKAMKVLDERKPKRKTAATARTPSRPRRK